MLDLFVERKRTSKENDASGPASSGLQPQLLHSHTITSSIDLQIFCDKIGFENKPCEDYKCSIPLLFPKTELNTRFPLR